MVIKINIGADRRSLPAALLAGARSGALATLSMTAGYELLHRAGWMSDLPPRQITRTLMPRDTSDGMINTVAAVSHLGYGALVGTLYAALRRSSPGMPTGIGYALLVCLASYEGWVPLARLRQPLHRDPPRQLVAVVIGHVLYGMDLGRRLAKNRTRS